jgi:hypothetical protein
MIIILSAPKNPNVAVPAVREFFAALGTTE